MGCEADLSPPHSTEVKNDGTITPFPRKSSWHSAQVIKQEKNLPYISIIIIIVIIIIIIAVGSAHK
jgi:hypothetical protein